MKKGDGVGQKRGKDRKKVKKNEPYKKRGIAKESTGGFNPNYRAQAKKSGKRQPQLQKGSKFIVPSQFSAQKPGPSHKIQRGLEKKSQKELQNIKKILILQQLKKATPNRQSLVEHLRQIKGRGLKQRLKKRIRALLGENFFE